MRSAWRVACVRIPRFPIGAVWRAARGGPPAAQLQLPLEEPGAWQDTPAPGTNGRRNGRSHDLPLPLPAPSPDRDDVPSRIMDGRAGPRAPFAPPAAVPGRHWDEHPIALVSERRLRAVSAAAGRLGVRAGMRVPEARARCAALEVLDWDELAVAREITRATAAFLDASPQVTPVAGAPGCWWIGAHGFDGLGGERALAYALRRIAKRWHPRARVAIADSCVAARAATWASASDAHGTRHGTGHAADSTQHAAIFIVPPGGCAAYLAPAPLALLPMDDEMREALISLGMRTIGALAALEPIEVEQRWGNAGIEAWRLARGDDRRRPVLERPEMRRAVEVELPSPVATMEPVLFLVRPALERLVAELVSEGRAVASIAITLTLDAPASALPTGARAHTVTREVRPAHPLGRAAPLFERCRSVLERWTLDAPVCGVTVAIAASAPLSGDQGSLLDTTWRDPAAIDGALAKLREHMGPGVIVRPLARDEHRPEKQGAWAELEDIITGNGRTDEAGRQAANGRTDQRTNAADAAANGEEHAALRLLEQPEPVEVEWGADAPRAFRWRGRRIPIARAFGPERLTGDWWKGRYRRDYWRCEEATEEHIGQFLVFEEEEGWFLQGWYD